MGSLPFTVPTSHSSRIQREIAPGVWIEVRQPSRIAHVPGLLHDVRDRISDALTTLGGRSPSVNLDEYLLRTERRAA